MKRLELLIEEARELSQNSRYDSDSGKSQSVFVRYFKNAQDVILRAIQNSKSKFLILDQIVPIVSGQELYSYPSRIYMQNIDTIEYSTDGVKYVPLTKCYAKDRNSQSLGFGFGYILRKDGFLLTPPVQSGFLRINYLLDINRPQIRQGRISALTLGSGVLSALTVDPSEASFDPTSINKENILCVCDKFGVQKAKNITYDSVNQSTGVFTLSSFTLDSGDSLAVGDYICVGENVTNKIELPTTCESFLILHATYQSKYGDSSSWTKEVKDDMSLHLDQLMDSFSRNSADLNQIPISNSNYLYL